MEDPRLVLSPERFKIKGEGWVLGLEPRIATYDDYLKLGFAPKKITWDLVEELMKDRVVEEAHRNDNLIVNAGLLQVVSLVTGNIASYVTGGSPAGWFNWVGVGSGQTAPSATDTDLQAYIGTRLQVSAAYTVNSNLAKWDTYFAPSVAVGTWFECGNFTTSGIGTGAMGSHLLINPTSGYVKGAASAILDIQWTI